MKQGGDARGRPTLGGRPQRSRTWAGCLLGAVLAFAAPGQVAAWDSVANIGARSTAPGTWSLGAGLRMQSSAYRGQDYRDDLVPLLTWNGKYLFLDGTRAGVRIYDDDDWRVEAFGAHRFGNFEPGDAPGLVGMERKDSVDVGLSLYRRFSFANLRLDASTDAGGKSNGQELTFTASKPFSFERWWLEPKAGVRWQSADLANYYYGVRPSEVRANRPAYSPGAALNPFIGVDVSYRVMRHHYLSLDLSLERLDSGIAGSPIVDERNLLTAFLAYRYAFGDPPRDGGEQGLFEPGDDDVWYLRLAGGYATRTSFNKIVRGEFTRDDRDTAVASVFIGKRIARTLFGLPIEVYATGGYVRHFEQDIQDDFNEYVLAFKIYYQNFPWSNLVRTRVGLGEGLSYADRIPTLERENVLKKNANASHLMNYLDFSVDANIGDIIQSKPMERCYLGFSIHHRSGLFAASDIFGGVTGGSNFNTLYVQCSNK